MTPSNKTDKKEHVVNYTDLPFGQEDLIITGWDEIITFIKNKILSIEVQRTNVLGVDGYIGTDWQSLIEQFKIQLGKDHFDLVFLNVEDCYLPKEKLDKLLEPYLGDDPIFGRVYRKDFISLFNKERLSVLKFKISKLKSENHQDFKRIIICYGSGALLSMLRPLYDMTIYCDLSREETLKRNEDWSRLSGKTQSIGPKKLYYVDMQVNDKHRNRLLKQIDYYIDGNDLLNPILLSAQTLQKITTELASRPFRLKYLYEPGPWGGQWLKDIRKLPRQWVNCAWSYEVIAAEMSLLVNFKGTTVDLPWTTFLYLQYKNILGQVSKRRFRGEFPVRMDYLDTMDGGDLSIQVHPGTKYIRKEFNETYHQGEMYYIVDAKEGSTVNLGLNEHIELEEFRRAAILADKQGIKFNYHDYVNSVPVKKHDLLMIPPGTVHGSGKDIVVLEVSAATYRYTFKIYDHLRPDLNGVMRPIHVEHAFNVIKPHRTKQWVTQNLIQEPVLIRSGKDWYEFLIGDRPEFFYAVYRLQFENLIEDDTSGSFNVLTLVEGKSATVQAVDDQNKRLDFYYSETIIIPASLGRYQIINRDKGQCMVVKARLKV